jgi:hypothetical protein
MKIPIYETLNISSISTKTGTLDTLR